MANLERLCINGTCGDVALTKEMILEALGYEEVTFVKTNTDGSTKAFNVLVEKTEVTYNTVLYTDGTLIINEPSLMRSQNVAIHGAVLNEFAPLDENNEYIFASYADRPYESVKNNVTRVEIGSEIAPKSMARWFGEMPNVESIDFTNLKSGNLTDISRMCSGCGKLARINTELLDTSKVTTMEMAFYNCFRGAGAIVDGRLNLSTWDTSKVTHMGQMFRNCEFLTTIYASEAFVVDQVTSSNNMFTGCINLVGGAGTRVNQSFLNKAYARIDVPPTRPGYFTEEVPIGG